MFFVDDAEGSKTQPQLQGKGKTWTNTAVVASYVYNYCTVLQSKRVDFEYGVFSAVFTGQTCMSRVIICYSVLSRIGLYMSENMDCNYL